MYFNSRNQVYDYLHANAKQCMDELGDIFPPDSHGGYICPTCNSGSGRHGTGITESKKNPGHFVCWAGDGTCFGEDIDGHSYGDIPDLVGAVYGITDPDDQLKKTCDLLGLNYSFDEKPSTEKFKQTVRNAINQTPEKRPEKPKNDRRERIIKALYDALNERGGTLKNPIITAFKNRNHPRAVEYITGERGISEQTRDYFGMGYFAGEYVGTRWFDSCVVFPSTYSSYCVRDTEPIPPDSGLARMQKPAGAVDIPVGLLQVIKNRDKKIDSTQTPEPVFVVEGLFDAPSIYEVGGDAIALNGTGNVEPIIWAFKEFGIKRPIILSMDTDEPGKKAQKTNFDKLKNAGLEVFDEPLIPEILGYKDANELLLVDREYLKSRVEELRHLPVREFEETLNRSKQNQFRDRLLERSQNPPIKTGFPTLDSTLFLDGGFRPGLYIIGAISSLGKTTFTLQIADQIATAGTDVIFFSLEMPESEIMGKSVSRYTLKNLYDSGALSPQSLPDIRAKSLNDIYRHYSDDSNGDIDRAIRQYFDDTGEHLRIVEGLGNIDADTIRTEVEKHIRYTGRVPVVFIDYLQLLVQPRDEYGKRRNMTDKQIVDANIFALKQISRDYNAVIFGISSFNRDNYSEPVSMKSFKESGAIEYSSDVLIGLEPEYMGIEDNTKEQKLRKQAREESKKREKETGIRKVRLKILKNRNGYRGGIDLFDYFPKFNFYRENANEKAKAEFKRAGVVV